MDGLPNELLIFIFSLVDQETVEALGLVCRRWRALSLAPAVWQRVRLVLCMNNYRRVRDLTLPRVAHNVRRVKLQHFKLYDQIRQPLTAACPNITHLEMSISQLDPAIFEDLKRWPRLKFLSFRNSLIIKSDDDNNAGYTFHLPFAHLPRLETLVLSNFGLTPASLAEMLTCRHLTTVNIEKMKNIPDGVIASLVASKLDTLQCICVNGDTLTDDVVRLISHCSRLRTLHITTCKSLFDGSLSALARLSGLTSLKLRHGYFSSEALVAYFSTDVFSRLTYLSLSRCLHVTMQVAETIKRAAPALQELSFYQCPFIMDKNFDRSEIKKLFDISLLLD